MVCNIKENSYSSKSESGIYNFAFSFHDAYPYPGMVLADKRFSLKPIRQLWGEIRLVLSLLELTDKWRSFNIDDTETQLTTSFRQELTRLVTQMRTCTAAITLMLRSLDKNISLSLLCCVKFCSVAAA